MRKSALFKNHALPSYSPMKKRGLTERRRKALRAFMASRGLSAAGWAKSAGIPASTLQSFLQGRSQSLRGENEQLLAAAIGVSVTQMYESDSVNLVPLVGKIGAGAIVIPFDGDEGVMGYVEAPPDTASKGLIAYEIDGFSMPPFKPGHKVFARGDCGAVADECLNDMCIVQIENGPRLFKILRKGYEPGTFNLESLDGEPPIENARLAWVAPVIGATF